MFYAYVEKPNGFGKDAQFETAEAAFEWLNDRLENGNYCSGNVIDDNGNTVSPE